MNDARGAEPVSVPETTPTPSFPEPWTNDPPAAFRSTVLPSAPTALTSLGAPSSVTWPVHSPSSCVRVAPSTVQEETSRASMASEMAFARASSSLPVAEPESNPSVRSASSLP